MRATKSIIRLFFIILVFITTLLSDDIFFIAQLTLFFLIVQLITSISATRMISLIDVWCVSFFYIIVSETLGDAEILQGLNGYGIRAVHYIYVCNISVVFGYYLLQLFKPHMRHKKYQIYFSNSKNNRKIVFFSISAMMLMFSAYFLQLAFRSITIGRVSAYSEVSHNGILSIFLYGFAYIIPATIAYYYRIILNNNNILPAFIYSLPIFIILVMLGSRFPLLFSFGGFILMYVDSINLKLMVKRYIPLLLVLFASVNFIGETRVGGISDIKDDSRFSFSDNQKEMLIYKIASLGSPEGVVYQTAQMIRYFDTNDHLYGVSSSFFIYSWIPRAVWSGKPTMSGSWLVRAANPESFSEGFSASYGFCGDFYIDFGFYGGVFICLFLGFALKCFDNFTAYYLYTNSYKKVLAALSFAYVFFFVRSPNTGTITFISVILCWYFYQLVMNKYFKIRYSNDL